MNIELLKNQDWFHDIGVDEYNRPVVYVHYMTMDNISYIQKHCGNVLVYFSGSLLCKNKYGCKIDLEPITEKDPLNNLIAKLSRLETLCSKNILQDIFYEIHDGRNAVTNLSSSFLEVRKELEELYNVYGFDILYENLV